MRQSYDVPVRVIPPAVFGEDLKSGLTRCARCRLHKPREAFDPAQFKRMSKNPWCIECKAKPARKR